MAPDILDFSDWTPVRIVNDIETMIRREGTRQYCANDSQLGFYRTQLCGVNAYLVPKTGLKRLYTPDMDLMITPEGLVHFSKGDAASLRAWHRHLNAWRRAMRTGSAIAA